ncbi:hypothetical protein G7Y89_g6560 [Cudoniella acicularis]|uniref:DUF7730 domain-containing protein n=1 Tax=Cudoniella acicularis TaxID=354080 RepID=A0A8H4W2R6_9HELO|nr:hypothetical protein G7Y89_g6560 [Cudoniella acicularis]
MGFTFDSPISIKSDAKTVAYRGKKRHQSTSSVFSPSTPYHQATTSTSTRRASTSNSTSFLSKILHPLAAKSKDKGAAFTLPIRQRGELQPVKPFPILKLPRAVREKIYGYAIARNEVLHLEFKHRPSGLPPSVRYRRCRGLNTKDSPCTSGKCRELGIQDGVYIGWFDSGVFGLLLSCRTVHEEVTNVLYAQNTFDFELPSCFNAFASSVKRENLDRIESLTFTLQAPEWVADASQSAHLEEEWGKMWETITEMKGVEEIRVRIRVRILGRGRAIGRRARELLLPTYGPGIWRDLAVFVVEVPWEAMSDEDESDRQPRPFELRVRRGLGGV